MARVSLIDEENRLIELGMIFNGAHEGGFFTLIARKGPEESGR